MSSATKKPSSTGALANGATRINTATATPSNGPFEVNNSSVDYNPNFKVKVFSQYVEMEYINGEWQTNTSGPTVEEQMNEWIEAEDAWPLNVHVQPVTRDQSPNKSTVLYTASVVYMSRLDHFEVQVRIMQTALTRLLPSAVSASFAHTVAAVRAANQPVDTTPATPNTKTTDPLKALANANNTKRR